MKIWKKRIKIIFFGSTLKFNEALLDFFLNIVLRNTSQCCVFNFKVVILRYQVTVFNFKVQL
jgi:hypothetical protein